MIFAASSGIVKAVGDLFHPIFTLFGWLLAQFYQIIPNYAVAISLLTILIMGILTPLTVKSTRSMVAMQTLQPELKKLQQKYKGPEHRAQLNEEMMRLYKEHGTNPLSSCFPVLGQAPFLFILYSVIRGLSALDPLKQAAPKYIPHTSNMYRDLIASMGQIDVFGMDMSLKPLDHHSSLYAAIPFFVMVAMAVGLQYFQMAQINNRNKKTGQEMPSQQQRIQKLMPIMFAYFYFIIPAAVVLYMVVSTVIRIATQDIMFRMGVSNPGKAKERKIPSLSKSPEKSAVTETEAETLKSQANRSKSKRQRKER